MLPHKHFLTSSFVPKTEGMVEMRDLAPDPLGTFVMVDADEGSRSRVLLQYQQERH